MNLHKQFKAELVDDVQSSNDPNLVADNIILTLIKYGISEPLTPVMENGIYGTGEIQASKMQEYIKLEGHNCWFLKLENGNSHTSDSYISGRMGKSYAELANEYGTLLIRDSGTWMTPSSNDVVTSTVLAREFPND